MAGLGIRYFLTVFAVRCGAPFRKPALIALSNKDIGGLHRLWCMHLTSFSLLVQWYEKDACSCDAFDTFWFETVLLHFLIAGSHLRGDSLGSRSRGVIAGSCSPGVFANVLFHFWLGNGLVHFFRSVENVLFHFWLENGLVHFFPSQSWN